jgi:hypothetical protein
VPTPHDRYMAPDKGNELPPLGVEVLDRAADSGGARGAARPPWAGDSIGFLCSVPSIPTFQHSIGFLCTHPALHLHVI